MKNSALMNGDSRALCFTKHGQNILRVLLNSLVDSLEKDYATEEVWIEREEGQRVPPRRRELKQRAAARARNIVDTPKTFSFTSFF